MVPEANGSLTRCILVLGGRCTSSDPFRTWDSTALSDAHVVHLFRNPPQRPSTALVSKKPDPPAHRTGTLCSHFSTNVTLRSDAH
jgi:hypothetical protein